MEIEYLEVTEKWQALIYIATVCMIGITFIAIILANRNKDG